MRTTCSDAGFTAKTASSNSTDREGKILAHVTLVPTVAKRLITRVPPCVTMDDLISAGTVGLVQAVDRFGAKHGVGFNTYAQHRILGAMLDHLRGDDPPSRAERSHVRRTEPDHAPATISLDQFSDSFSALATRGIIPQSAIADRVDLAVARNRLTSREAYVVTMLFDRDRPAAANPATRISRTTK
jgi:hypothetical protein